MSHLWYSRHNSSFGRIEDGQIITLLPTISKIVERVEQELIVQHMLSNNLYHPNQHVYRKGHSTSTALLELSDMMYQAAERKEITVSMSIYQSSAFNCICPDILDKKVDIYGLYEHSRKWIMIYLKFRSQYVEVGTKMSEMKPVECGVPQGSVLGLLLIKLGNIVQLNH